MRHRRTIAVLTGCRADFGLLLPVMRAIQQRRELALRVIAAGLHWVTGTWREVQSAGFGIDARVRMQQAGASGRVADVAALGRGVSATGKAIADLRPDVLMVLGDRIEALAGAAAASVGGVHVAHIHGGDRAEGVADEAMRHAVSKLAHLHFAASPSSRRRLIRMGEDPRHVFLVGSPAIDGLDAIPALSDNELRQLKLQPDQPLVIVLQHATGEADQVEQRRMALTLQCCRRRGGQIAAIGCNRDPGWQGVVAAVTRSGVLRVEHLPRPRFVGLLKRAAVLVGNSSAGVIEAAAVRRNGLPVVNIGDRQAGRDRAANVIDCPHERDAIDAALARALTRPPRCRRHPFGDGCTGVRIARILAEMDLRDVPLHKRNTY